MKIFAVSDIHGFYDEFQQALTLSKFDPSNKDHLLVVCGDLFDRGKQPCELIEFLTSVKNKVLIRGNHEDLLEQLCMDGIPSEYDFKNGTVDTVKAIGGVDSFSENCHRTYAQVKPLLNEMVDFFETQHYVFTHAWIPTTDDWRKAPPHVWEDARWVNPFQQEDPKIGKKIVCGHWHCSAGWAKQKHTSEFATSAIWKPYDGGYYLAIDRCTAWTHKVNVVVLKDKLIERT